VPPGVSIVRLQWKGRALTESSLDLTKVNAAITALELGVDAAELHGGICGLLCTQGPGAMSLWIQGDASSGDSQSAEWASAADCLHEAEAVTWRALNDPTLSFYPLLPDPEDSLATRVAAVAHWCHGFVTGLGLGGYSSEDAAFDDDDGGVRNELAELIEDFVEISRAGVGADEIDEADQADFDLAEVIEYVRVGVQFVFETLSPQRDSGASDAPLVTH
jgi:uncharacterized protein YgfB (UPF0149 family)